MNDWLVLAGLTVIFALAIYAALLWRRVWRSQQLAASQAAERNERLAGDIRILAQSLLIGQLPLIEGSIRIKVLLDNYGGPRPVDLNLHVFETIYDATAHIPTHQSWQDLSKPQRRLHERQMETLAQQYKAEVERAAQELSKGLI